MLFQGRGFLYEPRNSVCTRQWHARLPFPWQSKTDNHFVLPRVYWILIVYGSTTGRIGQSWRTVQGEPSTVSEKCGKMSDACLFCASSTSRLMPGGSLHHATVSAQNGKTKGESIKTDIGLEGMKNEKNGHLIAVTCISGWCFASTSHDFNPLASNLTDLSHYFSLELSRDMHFTDNPW